MNCGDFEHFLKIVDVAVEYGMGGTGCVVSNSSGISQANAKDLEGQKVAVPLNTMADYAFRMIMSHLGADASKVNVVDMEPADGAVALVDGNVIMSCMCGLRNVLYTVFGAMPNCFEIAIWLSPWRVSSIIFLSFTERLVLLTLSIYHILPV